MKKKKWVDVDNFMNYQEPVPRDEWKASNPYTMQLGGDFKKERDYTKCKTCGGTGTHWVSKGTFKRRRIQRLTKCDCIK